jgi:hypothetical protein
MLQQNLECWTQAGMFPMSYTQMFTGCGTLKDPVTCARTLIGDIIWGRMYEGRNVNNEFLVPCQLVVILKTALGKISDKLKADATRMAKIHATFEDFYAKDLVDKAAAAGAYGLLPY